MLGSCAHRISLVPRSLPRSFLTPPSSELGPQQLPSKMSVQAALRFRLRGKQSAGPPLPIATMTEAEGESSDNADESEAKQTARGACGQLVWPCPRQYPAEPGDRRRDKWLIPADLSKAEFGQLFKQICMKMGQGPNLVKVHVFDEPHKRYNKTTQQRERHKHLIFKMKNPFAHLRLQKELATHGVYAHFSFNLVGYVAYLRYCFVGSAKKLESDIDKSPWSWPDMPLAKLRELCKEKAPELESNVAGGRGRKRKLMTFSEVTDAFVETGIRTEKDAWTFARSRKADGDDTLYNTLGAAGCVTTLVAKVRRAWDCDRLPSGTLQKNSKFHLGWFKAAASISKSLPQWISGGWQERALIFSGKGGLGKTELACALAHAVAPAKMHHFVNKVDRIRDVIFSPGEALVVDEACLAARDLDDAKGLVDLEHTRDVNCRNKDGTIPQGTPRIFSTNWPWHRFWPMGALDEAQVTAIERRVLWINVKVDLRKLRCTTEGEEDKGMEGEDPFQNMCERELPVDDADEDPFGHGNSLGR